MNNHVVYGPVPSRRLGRSLGVDLVPYKICSYDCIYCQIGRTSRHVMERNPYIAVDKVVGEVVDRLAAGDRPDYITLGGSGEPTLNSGIGEIITRLRSVTDIPVAVLTNGSLLMLPEVRRELMPADVVLPSFDACRADMFQQINRPCPGIDFEAMAEGLIRFRREYRGRLWVELFLVDGINTADTDLAGFKDWMNRIRPDRIHLNTAVRPTAESDVRRPSDQCLMRAADWLGEKAEIVVPYQKEAGGSNQVKTREELLDLLSRRPCTLTDISDGLNAHPHEVLKYLEPLVDAGEIVIVRRHDEQYYQKKLSITGGPR